MAEVTEFLFDLPALEALECVPEHLGDLGLGHAHALRLNVSVPTELHAASLTLGDTVVGVVVGKFKGGGVNPASPA